MFAAFLMAGFDTHWSHTKTLDNQTSGNLHAAGVRYFNDGAALLLLQNREKSRSL